ncbi:MAG: hypothetical protein RR248_02470 [Clostridia bacterium]
MKNFFSLTQLDRMQIKQVVEIAGQMRRTLNSKNKKLPYLSGRYFAQLTQKHNLLNTAYQLAYNYLGGDTVVTTSTGDFCQEAQQVCASGVSLLGLSHDNYAIIEQVASSCSCQLLNMGTKFTNPIKALSILTTIADKCDRIGNLNVITLGYADLSFIAELSYAFKLFDTNFFAYLPTNDTEFTQKSNIIVLNSAQSAFEGADAIIDLGVQYSSQLDYYGNKLGIPKSLIGKARVDAPLFFNRNYVDNNNLVEYPFNVVDKESNNFISVIMAVFYLFFKV